MADRIVVLGAGALSLGFLGPELRDEYEMTFLDTHYKADLVEGIQKRGVYTMNLAASEIQPLKVEDVSAFRLDVPEQDAPIRRHIEQTRLFFTAVGVKNLDGALNWLYERIRDRKDSIYILCSENGENIAEKWRARFPRNIRLLDTVMGRMCRIEEKAEPDYTPVLPGLDWGVVGEAFYGMPLPRSCYDSDVFHARAFNFVSDAEFHARERIKLYAHNGLHFFISAQGRLRNVERLSDLADDPKVTRAARELLDQEIAPALWKDCGRHVGRETFNEYIRLLPDRLFSKTLRDQVARGVRNVDSKFAPNERILGGLRLLLENGIQPRRFYDLIAAGLEVARRDLSEQVARKLYEQIPDEEARHEVEKRWKRLMR